MEQLKMLRDNTMVEEFNFPEGFFMRSYNKGDELGWCRCMINGDLGVEEIKEEVFEEKMLKDKSVNPNNIFFLISSENEIAGTVTYQYTDDKAIGFIHMVGIDPRYRGRKLALPMHLYVIKKMLEDSVEQIFLTTDDWRLPAIKVYLNAGFKPVFYQPDMEGRWNQVMAKLRMKNSTGV